ATAATRGSTVSADSVRDGNAAPSLARPAWLAARAARSSSNATGAPGRRAATTTGVGAALTMIAARAVRTVTCSPAAAPSGPATRGAGGATGGEGCGALTGGAGAAGALAITTPGGSSAASPDVGVAGGTSRGVASG